MDDRTGQQRSQIYVRKCVRAFPTGRRRLSWYAPAMLWVVSSVGSGSLLFTPRVAAKYEYALLWAAVLTCLFMWSLIREAARYTIVTGKTMLDGFNDLPGPRGWALWIIFLPQLVAAVVGIAGLSALTGSAFNAAFGGPNEAYTIAFIACSTTLVALGGYGGVQRLSVVLAGALIILSVIAAITILPGAGPLVSGLKPSVPRNLDHSFVLPWIGTILAGSMGILWFSYWTATRGYGGPSELSAEYEKGNSNENGRESADAYADLKRWVRLASRAAGLAVIAGLVVIIAFTVLGAELLASRGEIPSGADVVKQLAGLLEGVWGRFGFWAMIALALIIFGGSVIANQDGWARSFADITVILWRKSKRPDWMTRRLIQNAYVIVVAGFAPAVVYFLIRDPVVIMSTSGTVAAFHTPVIAGLILWANILHIPKSLSPSFISLALVGMAAVYYLGVSAARFVAG